MSDEQKRRFDGRLRPPTPPKGRGAVSNPANRYEPRRVVPLDDGWGGAGGGPEWAPGGEPGGAPEGGPGRVPTSVTPEASRTILSRNDSPDVPFDRSINPYKGCEHGCVYCFARPTHAYLGLSPGLDFETKIFSKPDAARLLEEELRRPSYCCEVIALGANTNPYQPAECELGITRRILETLDEHGHPVGVVTKSNLVLRDLDILVRMAERKLACVFLSITTLDLDLARRMEPRAPTPQRRLEAIRILGESGVPVGVLAAPMIPGLNDAELERILEAAAGAGAQSAGYVLVRLPLEVKELFGEWLEAHYPLKKDHVLSLIRQTHGGRLYDPEFGARMRGTGPYADLLRQRFAKACRRLGLGPRLDALDTTQFRVPPRKGDQPSLFGDR